MLPNWPYSRFVPANVVSEALAAIQGKAVYSWSFEN
jgi:hypothetical protein